MPLSCHFSPPMITFACGSCTKELKFKFRQPCEARRNEKRPPSRGTRSQTFSHFTPVASHQQRSICRHPRKWPTFVVQGHSTPLCSWFFTIRTPWPDLCYPSMVLAPFTLSGSFQCDPVLRNFGTSRRRRSPWSTLLRCSPSGQNWTHGNLHKCCQYRQCQQVPSPAGKPAKWLKEIQTSPSTLEILGAVDEFSS